MTSLQPRLPYSPEELQALYPDNLELISVQVFFRHGERTPQSVRFKNTGLLEAWPYCHYAMSLSPMGDARRLSDSVWKSFTNAMPNPWGIKDITNGICHPSQLTDRGRNSTLALGSRLRRLYIHQLGFLPTRIQDRESIQLRATHYSRTQESLHQVFLGLYPQKMRAKSFVLPQIIIREPEDETLFPNEEHCPRFMQLFKGFSRRTAERWNSSEEMDYLNRRLQRWMPSQERVAVDSNPSLHGIYDSINSTYPNTHRETRLPDEFYDAESRSIIDQICTEEEFSGFKESVEYRTLGIGNLLGEVVASISVTADFLESQTWKENKPEATALPRRQQLPAKFAMFGCHDSTLAAVLASLGAMQTPNEAWPPYTSSLIIELFGQKKQENRMTGYIDEAPSTMSRSQGTSGDNYYIRLRYNDRPVMIPGCQAPENHLEGDKTFCTLASFKAIVAEFTPRNWKQACVSNLGKPVFPINPVKSQVTD